MKEPSWNLQEQLTIDNFINLTQFQQTTTTKKKAEESVIKKSLPKTYLTNFSSNFKSNSSKKIQETS